MLQRMLVVDVHGAVDQYGLERLRAHLELQKRGRLTDDWDQAFGDRKMERAGGQYRKLGLYRQFDGSWIVSVSDTEKLDPNSADLVALRTELVGAIEAAGYEATIRAKPTYGTYTDYIASTKEAEGTDPQ